MRSLDCVFVEKIPPLSSLLGVLAFFACEQQQPQGAKTGQTPRSPADPPHRYHHPIPLLPGDAQEFVTEAASYVAWAQGVVTAADVYQICSVLMSYDFVVGVWGAEVRVSPLQGQDEAVIVGAPLPLHLVPG